MASREDTQLNEDERELDAAIDRTHIPEVGRKNYPPYLELVNIKGLTRRLVPNCINTLEDRDEVENNHGWWRYSSIALAWLLFCAFLAMITFFMNLWTSDISIARHRAGVPQWTETEGSWADDEGGMNAHARHLRLAAFALALFSIMMVYLFYYGLKPRPNSMRLFTIILSVLIILSTILAIIAFVFDVKDVGALSHCSRQYITDARRGDGTFDPARTQPCTRLGGSTYFMIISEVLFVLFGLTSAILLFFGALSGRWRQLRTGWREQLRDVELDSAHKKAEEERSGLKSITAVKKAQIHMALLFFLGATFALLIWTLVLQEQRNERVPRYVAFGVEALSIPEAGWPRYNTWLHFVTTGLFFATLFVNLTPIVNRNFHLVCGWLYFAIAILGLVSFGYDMDSIRSTKKDSVCPAGFACKYSRFVATAVFTGLFAIFLLGYVVYEYITRAILSRVSLEMFHLADKLPCTQCRHCYRCYTLLHIVKHETSECSKREVRCEICHEPMTAEAYVYKHRFWCGPDYTICQYCKQYIPTWGINGHMDECGRQPIKCSMCTETFYREQMPEHVLACPFRAQSCQSCGDSFKAKDIAAHLEVCPEVITECAMCLEKMQRWRLKKHTELECPKRMVQCELCDEAVPCFRLEMHQRRECSERMVQCDRCLDTVPWSQKKAHSAVCPVMMPGKV